MEQAKKRSPSEVLKRGYSDEEIAAIYELGRRLFENGDMRRAESVMTGLTEVAPDYPLGWLGLAYLHSMSQNWDGAIFAARQALRLDPELVPAMLCLIACLLSTGDVQSAGTYLGEVQERIESGATSDSGEIRFFRAQLARYQSRG